MTDRRVLILGASGVFGRLCCERLRRVAGLRLVLVARDRAKLRRFANQLPYDACELRTFDLADGRDFVSGFDKLDSRARAAGVLAVSGASSVPGLSGCVLDHLTQGLARVRRIDMGISPGNRSPRGRAVVTAVLGYAGEPIPIRLRSGETTLYGWQGLVRKSLPAIGARWFCDCDVPDLALLPARYPDLEVLRFRAGAELAALHFGLWLLAGLRRARLLPNLRCLASPFYRLLQPLGRFGSDNGAMYVEVEGETADGRYRHRSWHLTARGGHGPYVPVTPAVILIRKIVEGALRARGAGPCLGYFNLADFEREVADLDIATETREWEATSPRC